MGLIARAWANVRRLRAAVYVLRQRGYGLAAALLVQLPAGTLLRAYRAVAQPINGSWLGKRLNVRRFDRFQDGLASTGKPRLYVIVMPLTLHFLLPCLALLRHRAEVVLLYNGARSWERALLKRRFPALPGFSLRAMPFSSVMHGDVVSMLILQHRGNFGIVDHDCYIFDEALYQQLTPAPDECLVGIFEDTNERTGLVFPLTHFLYFNAEPLRELSLRYGVDARLYRRVPASAHQALFNIGLGLRSYFKSYQRFHDTLHVLLAVAFSEGFKLRTVRLSGDAPTVHVGGTSIGSHHTKNMFALYIHLRFLALVDDPEITSRYRFLTHPMRDAADALQRRLPGDPLWDARESVDDLVLRLEPVLKQAVASPP